MNKFKITFPSEPLTLGNEQAHDLFRRLEMAVAEVNDHPEYYDPKVNVQVTIAHNSDAFPDGYPNERDYVAIPYGDDHHLFVFVDENYVTQDGEVRFE